MKTIKEQALKHGFTGDLEEAFIAGAEAAQEWYPIERDKDGFITGDQFRECYANKPLLVKYTDGSIDLYYQLEQDDPDMDSWRPINIR
ncbi:MAG: hypothetical protein WCS17_01845 [Prevotella sp.]